MPEEGRRVRSAAGKLKAIGLAVILVFMPAMTVSYAGIASTKHNLSTSGQGTVKAESEERICVFCHTPHNAMTDLGGVGVPLWNHTLSSATYQLFSSATLLSPSSPTIQPDGSSRLCLSCHDGTVAVASVINIGSSRGAITMSGTSEHGELLPGPNRYGTDLSGEHPISIELNDSLKADKETQCIQGLVIYKVCNPPASSKIPLKKTNNRYGGVTSGIGVQCSTCHDPHEDPVPGVTQFLRLGDKNDFDVLCSECHKSDCAVACP